MIFEVPSIPNHSRVLQSNKMINDAGMINDTGLKSSIDHL